MGPDPVRRITQPFGRFEFSLGVDDFRSPFPLRFRLLRQSPLHLLRKIDVFDLDIGDLDSPGFSLFINDFLQVQVDLIPLGQKVVQLALP